jgi:hypothetical protein
MSMSDKARFAAFADDGYLPRHKRYWSIGLVSLPVSHIDEARSSLTARLPENIRKIEWKDIRGHRPKTQAAISYIAAVPALVKHCGLRADILTFDLHDTRHSLPGRDELANLQRMYYNVFRHAARVNGSKAWEFHPDKGSNINWDQLRAYLNQTGLIKKKVSQCLRLFPLDNEKIRLESLEERSASEEPLLQLADLLAGIAYYSMHNPDLSRDVCRCPSQGEQTSIFTDDPSSLTNPETARFDLMLAANRAFASLGPDLVKGYFSTKDPREPINFWLYRARREDDKAPTRALHDSLDIG